MVAATTPPTHSHQQTARKAEGHSKCTPDWQRCPVPASRKPLAIVGDVALVVLALAIGIGACVVVGWMVDASLAVSALFTIAAFVLVIWRLIVDVRP